jgi:two-component system, cell cycle sensor histidine kinase and response regulator CckA
MASIQQVFARHEAAPLPRSQTSRGPATQVEPATARILVADDEEGVRAIVACVLNRQGYAVTQAEDGQAALELLEAGREDYDMVILDVDMPRLNGYQTYQRIRASRPELPVLFISGAPDALVWDLLAAANLPRLTKPFSIASLVGRVRGLLTGC